MWSWVLSLESRKKAQTSTELLAIIAVALVLMVALVFIYQIQSAGVAMAKEDEKARNVLSDLGADLELHPDSGLVL